jgi:acyl carrier protein
MDNATAVSAILDAVQQYNDEASPDRRIPPTPDAKLFGRGGALDSLGLVNLILLVEERISDQYGVALTLADERAMSQEKSPFRNVQTLAEYICFLMNGSNRG